MVTILELENAAARLRRELKIVLVPELRLLCCLRFVDVLLRSAEAHREPYLREFVPPVVDVAQRSDLQELLPQERKALIQFLRTATDHSTAAGEVAPASDETIELVRRLEATGKPASSNGMDDGQGVRVKGLFVEYYPDLDLAPRGRLLTLRVSALALPRGAESDDVVVRNPISEPDDRFLSQARDSVAAARRHLSMRYGWKAKTHFRFDFAVESSGARFTGDSLGVAFAVGAVAALGRLVAFKDHLAVSPQVAFCGALAAHGVIAPVDGETLRLKIYRALHAGVTVLVLPRAHMTEAWTYLKQLEAAHPGLKLELMGADTLDDVASDPRLMPAQRLSLARYAMRWALRGERRAVVQIPMLVLLLYLATGIAYPKSGLWFDWEPARLRVLPAGFEIYNRKGEFLWHVPLGAELDTAACSYVMADLNRDGRAEIAFMPFGTSEHLEEQNQVFVFGRVGGWVQNSFRLLFSRTCTIPNQYPHEDISARFQPEVHVADTDIGTILLTMCFRSEPARSHIRIWSAAGDSLGWYIHSGAAGFRLAIDHDHDGHRSLVFTCINNRSKPRSAGLFLLPVSGAFGVSPPYTRGPEYDLSSVIPGNQIAYLQFPPTDYALSQAEPYNKVVAFRVEGDSLWCLDTNELPAGKQVGLRYFIRPSLRLSHVTADDWFMELRRRRDTCSSLAPVPDWNTYLQDRAYAVRHWTDSGWVTEGQLSGGYGGP